VVSSAFAVGFLVTPFLTPVGRRFLWLCALVLTAVAAGAVIMDSSLERSDEFLHLSRRMRSLALQSAVGGMAASLVGMLLAAAGYLPPVAGAIAQEIIDVLAVLNALRVAIPPKTLSDY
jgi:hypothetical protein